MQPTITNLRRAGTGALAGVVLAGLSLVGQSAFAQDVEKIETGAETPTAQTGRAPVTLALGLSTQAETDVDDGTSFSIMRFLARAGLPMRLNDELVLATTIKYELASYDFKDTTEPWEDIHMFSLVSLLQWQLDERWSIYGGPVLRIAAESGADAGDGFTGGGLIAANYAFSDTFTLGFGLAVMSQLENDPMVLPLLTLNWQINEDWLLKLGFVDVATSGYGAQLGWDIAENWTLAMGLQFHKSRFRIQGDGVSEDGVAEESAAVVYGAATWHATETLDFDAFLGVAAGGNLLVEDDGGSELFDEDYDPAPTFGLKVTVRL